MEYVSFIFWYRIIFIRCFLGLILKIPVIIVSRTEMAVVCEENDRYVSKWPYKNDIFMISHMILILVARKWLIETFLVSWDILWSIKIKLCRWELFLGYIKPGCSHGSLLDSLGFFGLYWAYSEISWIFKGHLRSLKVMFKNGNIYHAFNLIWFNLTDIILLWVL